MIKKWYWVYWDKGEQQNLFEDQPLSNVFFHAPIFFQENFKYLGMVEFSVDDFPIKYPLLLSNDRTIGKYGGLLEKKNVLKKRKEVLVTKLKFSRIFEASKGISTHANKRSEIREAVYARDGRKCLKCGRKDVLTLDHVIPKSKGGLFTYANLQTMCLWCNEEKGIETIDYRTETNEVMI